MDVTTQTVIESAALLKLAIWIISMLLTFIGAILTVLLYFVKRTLERLEKNDENHNERIFKLEKDFITHKKTAFENG